MVSYCDHWMSFVRRQQLLQRTSPKLLAGFYQILVGMILIWPSLKIIVQMVPVNGISDTQAKNYPPSQKWPCPGVTCFTLAYIGKT